MLRRMEGKRMKIEFNNTFINSYIIVKQARNE